MLRRLLLLWVGLLFLLASCGAPTANDDAEVRLSLAEAMGGGAAREQFARVTQPRPFVFPQDHGPHQAYATEWWYYTGNLETADGRHIGYQLTFFRFGLSATEPARASDWATSNIWMAHFALSDVSGNTFHAADRFSRGAAGLAGAQAAPFRVWLEGWSAEGTEAAGTPMRLRAAHDSVAIDLTLEQGKPVVLQGDQGLSQKSAEPGNASYYYSLTRMPTSGTVTIDGQAATVTGLSWMDREWSTSALSADQVGWDWFSIQLDDGRELMYYQLRHRDGSIDPYSKGILVAADGSSQLLARDDLQLDVTGTWQSSASGATYPAGWRIQVPSVGLDLRLTPYLPDQELRLAVVYWEGAVRVTGTAGDQSVAGNAYVELTGYAEQAATDGFRVR